jgi:hypothetical protein
LCIVKVQIPLPDLVHRVITAEVAQEAMLVHSAIVEHPSLPANIWRIQNQP